jgi:hypothetical protein
MNRLENKLTQKVGIAFVVWTEDVVQVAASFFGAIIRVDVFQ